MKLMFKRLISVFLFRKYVKNNELLQKDINQTYNVRNCKVDYQSVEKRFYHLMQNYPEFSFVFLWRINKSDSILKNVFSTQMMCKIFKSTKIEGGLVCFHPFSTVINAKSIGENFEFRSNLTIGNKYNDNNLVPIIGNNVTVGANVCIIGSIEIGDNVVIGAGAVVVNSVPSNSVAVGNPAKVVKKVLQ